jgi:hypothetical protein
LPIKQIKWVVACCCSEVSEETFQSLFAKMDFSDECRAWDLEADLGRVVKYVRGSKKLSIPPEWKNLIPKSIPL